MGERISLRGKKLEVRSQRSEKVDKCWMASIRLESKTTSQSPKDKSQRANMPIEIEKKYRLTIDERDQVIRRLRDCGAEFCGDELEENTLFTGGIIDIMNSVLRLRRVGSKAILAFKESIPSNSSIKKRKEDETQVDDAEAITAILNSLGYKQAIVYEKRRATWRLANAEVVVDELPFGLFMEIEGEEKAILEAESQLRIQDLTPETTSYPRLAIRHGTKIGDVVESRF